MRIAILTAVTFAVTAAASAAFAIEPLVYRGHAPYGAYRHHASTYEEGVLRGTASLYRGVGQFNYLNSVARINNEKARSAYLDNRLKATQTYFEMRRINREAVAQQQGPRPTAEDANRWARQRAPERLSHSQYDADLGKLLWPAVLDEAEFADDREALSGLFSDRMLTGSGAGTRNDKQVQRHVDSMLATLKENIGEMSPSDYVTAKKFLMSLKYESRFAPGTSGLAAR